MEEANIKVLIDAANSAKTIKDLKTSLKELKNAALQVEEGSEAFRKLTNAASLSADKIKDLNEKINGLDPGAKAQAFVTMGQGIAGSFGLATGAAALFGSQNEAVEETLKRIQATTLILQGAQSVADSVKQAGIVKNIALLKLQELETKKGIAATEGMSVAQRVLNLVLSANPLGIILTVVGGIIAYFADWGAIIEAVKNGFKAFFGYIQQGFAFVKNLVTQAIGYYLEYLNIITFGLVDLGGSWKSYTTEVTDSAKKQKAEYDALKEKVEALKKVGAELVKGYEEQIKILKKQKEAVIDRYDHEIRLAKAAGKETKEIEIQKLKDVRDNLEKTLLMEQKVYNEKLKMYRAQAELAKADGINVFDIEEIKAEADLHNLNKKKKAFKATSDELKKINEDLQVAEVEAVTKANDEKKKNYEKYLEDKKKKDEKAEEDRKKAEEKAEEERKKRLEEITENSKRIAEAEDEARKLKAQLITDDKARERELAQQEFEDKLDKITGESEQENELRALLLEERNANMAEIDAKYADKEKAEQEKRDKEELDALKAKEEAKKSIKESSFSILTSLSQLFINDAKKQEKATKLITLAQLGMDTASAISSLVKMSQANPANAVTGGVAGIAQYISGFAQILGNMAKAKALLSKSGGGDSGGDSGLSAGGAGGGGGAGAQLVNLTLPTSGGSDLYKIGGSDSSSQTLSDIKNQLSNRDNVQKAYVVSDEISGMQRKDEIIERRATFNS